MSYGQNPYGQNPYGGQPQQNPPGQRPYGGQPQQNPYGGQPQPNPYGQPGQGRPPGQPNPYGQPQQPNPYGQPGQGAANPYARPSGQPPQNQPTPYGQPPQGAPTQNPYAPQPDPAEAWLQNQPPPAAAAEPLTIAAHAVPVHTLPEDLESFAIRSLGEVIGVALRPRTNDAAALTRVRQEAVSRMAEMAQAAGADAVIGLRFDSAAEEVVAYGTAVELSDELDYEVVDDFETRPGDTPEADTAEDIETAPVVDDGPDEESTRVSTFPTGPTTDRTETGDREAAQPAPTDPAPSAGPVDAEDEDITGGPRTDRAPQTNPYGQNPYGQRDTGQRDTGQRDTGQGWPFSSGS